VVPPDPVTGVKDVAAKELVKVFVGIVCAAASGPLITSANDFELVAPLVSVAVTV
jgi:hypothetical protein